MASISELKKKRSEQASKLREGVKNNQGGGNSYQDERFWKPKFDAEKGYGRAKVRFLPEPPGEELPWVKLFRHHFKGKTGKRYVENSLTTIGQSDPVSEMNSRLWNSGIDSDKDVARGYKRQVRYYSNVLILEDPANPENEGKVFLWDYGQSIFNLIEESMFPEDPDEEAIIPFDPWEGCDFVIKMKGVDLNGTVVPNYDKKSYFEKPSPLCDGDDDEIEKVWNQCHSLEQFVKEDNFKTYDQLKKRLFEVLGPTVGSGVHVVEGYNEVPEGNDAPATESNSPDPVQETVTEPTAEKDVSEDSASNQDGDEDLDYFKKLLNN